MSTARTRTRAVAKVTVQRWGRRFFDSASVTIPAGTKAGLDREQLAARQARYAAKKTAELKRQESRR